MRQLLLQNATGITKCDRCYYKMRQVLQNATLLQNATVQRIYDKRQACYYCAELKSKIARHYEGKHGNEREVAIALSYEKGSPQRLKHLEKLRLSGNYHHNLNVLETGSGQLIVVRRPSNTEKCNPDDYLPCTFCLGFIRRQDLWKHANNCQFKPKDANNLKYQKVQAKAKILIMPSMCSIKGSSSLLTKIVASMRSDDITIVARNDPLIMAVGTVLTDKHGLNGSGTISQKMRELSRLLSKLRETDHRPNARLMDFIRPDKFDVVIEAVKEMCKFQVNSGKQDVGTPSLALKVGHSLKKCVQIVRGRALRDKDKSLLEDAENFEKLLQTEWSDRISHHSLTTLGDRKYNKVDLLPLAEDLKTLRNYVLGRVSLYTKSLEHQPSLEAWGQLAQATLTRLVMFNKRRGGEASKILLESYTGRPDWTTVNSQEIMSSLDAFERELSKK